MAQHRHAQAIYSKLTAFFVTMAIRAHPLIRAKAVNALLVQQSIARRKTNANSTARVTRKPASALHLLPKETEHSAQAALAKPANARRLVHHRARVVPAAMVAPMEMAGSEVTLVKAAMVAMVAPLEMVVLAARRVKEERLRQALVAVTQRPMAVVVAASLVIPNAARTPGHCSA